MRNDNYMNKRQKKILIIALAILLIGLILLLLFLYLSQKSKKPAVTNGNTNINSTLPYNPQITNANQGFKTPEKALTTPDPNETQVSVLSKNFSERFGSYSNQSNSTSYLDDFALMATAGMQNYLNNFIKTITSENTSNYHGITTIALKVEIKNLGDEQAESLVTTQRTETNESQNITNKVYYQDLKLKIVKVNNQWLVDGAWWQ